LFALGMSSMACKTDTPLAPADVALNVPGMY
jgi:hypothetical protein